MTKLLLKFISLFLLLSVGVSFVTEASSEEAGNSSEEPPITIGLIHFSPPLSKDMDFSPTLKHLQEVLAPRKVIARVYSSEKLEHLVETGEIDFFFASSGFYWRMLPFGAINIASIVIKGKEDPNKGSAGTFITQLDRKDIKSLEDMRNKTILVNYETGFHGHRIGMAEIAAHGWNPDKFFSEKIFVGENANLILNKVLNGEADIGYIKACWLEEFAMQNRDVVEKLKVIAPRAGPIACLHSTGYYPNNTFGATSKVSNELAKEVTVALLTMPIDKYGQTWSIATDFITVDTLYKNLEVGPYAYLREWSFSGLISKYWQYLVIVLLIVLGLIAHSWRATILVEKRTRELKAETAQRKKVEQKAQELSAKMETEQKLNLVGHLSSMFAHEMNQPLTACTYFLDGIKELIKNGIPDKSLLDYSITQMKDEIGRASAIVKRVRSYTKKDVDRSALINTSELINEVAHTLETRFNGEVSYKIQVDSATRVAGDPLEVQLLFWNLLKNAAEAAHETDDRVITVREKKEGEKVYFVIENNGHEFTDEEIEKLKNTAFASKKNDGLGIGLSVVFSIAEATGGNICLYPRKGGGLRVVVKFPIAKEEENG